MKMASFDLHAFNQTIELKNEGFFVSHNLDTRLLHIGSAPFDPATGTAPVNLPSMRTSTVRFENLDRLQETVARRM